MKHVHHTLTTGLRRWSKIALILTYESEIRILPRAIIPSCCIQLPTLSVQLCAISFQLVFCHSPWGAATSVSSTAEIMEPNHGMADDDSTSV